MLNLEKLAKENSAEPCTTMRHNNTLQFRIGDDAGLCTVIRLLFLLNFMMMRRSPIEPDLTKLQQIFDQRRAAAGQTYDQLSELSGVARRTLLYIGTGKSHGELRSWLMLSRTWGVPLDELLAPVWETTDQ